MTGPIAASADDTALDESAALRRRRAIAESFVELATEPDGVRWERADAGGVPGLWAVPVDARKCAVVVHLHGGGYITGSSASHRRLGGHLARAVGARVLLLDYARAPERPHPAALDDAVRACRWLLGGVTSTSGLLLSGDSSGGGLALATAQRLRDEGIAAAGVVAMSPWTDLTISGDSSSTNAEFDAVVTAENLRAIAVTFLAGGDPKDPSASPLFGDFAGLCPLYLQVGGHEVLLDDSRRVAVLAGDADVDVELDVVPEMQHVFQMRAGNLAEADLAIDRIGAWAQRRLNHA